MRISSLLLALALAGCGRSSAPPVADGAEHVACALAGATQFAPTCAVERSQQGSTLVLVVRHPDGGFRRFDVVDTGQGLAVTDGAQVARVAIRDGLLDVTVGPDRYRFPMTLRRNAAPH